MAVILEDTRNQIGKHKALNEYLQSAGYKVVRQAMYVGDYMAANNGGICVDTKKDVLELIMDMHQDHERFRSECERAQEAGIQLYVLIEEALPEGKLEKWRSPVYQHTTRNHIAGMPMTRTNPVTLRKSLVTMTEKYGVRFRFCDKSQTGEMLLRLLGLKGVE